MRLDAAGWLTDLAARLQAQPVVAPAPGAAAYRSVCVSDTISEALRDAGPDSVLVISHGNAQVVRAATMIGAVAVVVCAGAEIDDETTERAQAEEIGLLRTAVDSAECGRRLAAMPKVPWPGLDSAQAVAPSADTIVTATFPVLGDAFMMAGYASRRVRELLRAAGVSAELVRRVSIATYEAEMNVVIYAPQGAGSVAVRVTPDEVQVAVSDNGPGIEDLARAMQPGYSTAPPKAREIGFGAGMGLPNIEHCCDELRVESDHRLGGTRVLMRFCRNAPRPREVAES